MSEDERNVAHLSQMVFTLPIALEDIAAIYTCAKSMTWSATAKFDASCIDGKTVTMTIYVGGNVFRQVWHGV